jgi:hypothetical protein
VFDCGVCLAEGGAEYFRQAARGGRLQDVQMVAWQLTLTRAQEQQPVLTTQIIIIIIIIFISFFTQNCGSQIQNQQQKKERGEKNLLSNLLVATNIQNLKLFYFVEKNVGQFSKNFRTF